MSYKLASYVSLVFFFLLGLAFLFTAQSMPEGAGQDVGPGFFPSILSVLMMLACLMGAYNTWRRPEDAHVDIPNPRNLAIIVAVAVAFVGLWYLTGQFLVLSFVAIAMLLYLLNPAGTRQRKAAIAVVTSLILVTIIYVVFIRLLGMRF